MKLNYFPDTDSLYIDLSQGPSVESQEVSEGVVLDYDGEGNLVGIDIDHASSKLDLRELVTNHIPLKQRGRSLSPVCCADACAVIPIPSQFSFGRAVTLCEGGSTPCRCVAPTELYSLNDSTYYVATACALALRLG